MKTIRSSLHSAFLPLLLLTAWLGSNPAMAGTINEFFTGNETSGGSSWTVGTIGSSGASGAFTDVLLTTPDSTTISSGNRNAFVESWNVTNGTSYIWQNSADQSQTWRAGATNATDSVATWTDAVSGVANDLVFLSNNSNLTFARNPLNTTQTITFNLRNSGNFNISSGSTLTMNAVVSSTNTNGINALTITGAGTTIFTAANTYAGVTTVSGGTLQLNNNLALQNSAIDTSGAGGITLSGATVPTLGGLIGSKFLASLITTGYNSVTSLTLNPGTGVTNSYSGVIANGAAGMTVTKSGAGTQILSGPNTYTGATTVSLGTLEAAGMDTLANTSSVSITGGTLLLSGSGNRINTSAGFSLSGGGKLAVGGTAALSEAMGILTVGSGTNVIDFGTTAGTTDLTFANSNGVSWDGNLRILNWGGTAGTAGGPDRLFFNSAGLTAPQVSTITFFSDGGSTSLGQGSFVGNELVPVPEPTALLGSLAAVGAALRRRRA